ncbi:YfcC family protein [Oscillospiraceae bacterium LTW-04]|nr:TIGR00366 family protein [Oscillospiraceae bacterium MB24-C1]
MQDDKKISKKLAKHPFWGLILMVILTVILTWLIPAGQYDRYVNEAGLTVVDPSSFHYVENNPAGIADMFRSFYYGFTKAAGVMGAVSFVGGAFGVLKGIGILNAAVVGLTHKMRNKPFYLLAGTVMLAIALHHSFTGFRELDVVFVALMIPICLEMGYDTMTGAGVVLLGSTVGFTCALANPFFTGIAHEIAELPMYSAMWFRGMVMLTFLLIGLLYINSYAKKVKADPTKSITFALEAESRARFIRGTNSDEAGADQLTTREKVAGCSFLIVFAYMVFGCIKLGFGFAEVAACFFAMSLLTGFIAGKNLNEICYLFTQGIADILVAIYIIFFARAILVLMEDALIIDTVIHFLSQFVIGSSSVLSAVIVFILQCLINFFIPSGSGQAVITMPIITPLADMGGITRQVACLASQLGDGITNYIYPTNGGLLATLAVAGLSYAHWAKFAWKIILLMVILCAVFVAGAQMIGLML